MTETLPLFDNGPTDSSSFHDTPGFGKAPTCLPVLEVVMVTASDQRTYEFKRPLTVAPNERFNDYLKRLSGVEGYRGYARRLRGTNFWLATHEARPGSESEQPDTKRMELAYRLSRFVKAPVVIQFREALHSVCTSDGSGTAVNALQDVAEQDLLSLSRAYFQAVWRLPTFRVIPEEDLDPFIQRAASISATEASA